LTILRTGALAAVGALLALAPGLPLPAAARSPEGRPLRFRASYPARGLQFVESDPVVLRFSTDVDFSTLDASSVVVAYGSWTLPGSFAPAEDRRGGTDPRVVVFTPDLPLPAGQQVRFRVSTAVASALGRPLEDPVDFSFWTAPGKGTEEIVPVPEGTRLRRAPRLGPRPEVAWTNPMAGMGNTYADEVRIHFDRAMDLESLDGGGVRILAGGVAPVPGTLEYSSSRPVEVLFTPKDPFPPATGYQMVVSRDARSVRGRSLGTEFRASFGTSPLKDGVKPLKPGDFQPGPDLAVGRAFHTASLLDTGDVLLAGGEASPGVSLSAAEVFRRSSTSFVRVGDMGEARRKHAAVTLESGRVLVCGGFGAVGTTLGSVEIFNPADGSWTSAAPMGSSRASHTATLLQNGTVLVSGGFTSAGGVLAYEPTGEVYNPSANAWTPAGPLAWPRGGHTATRLPDGRVLLAGGESSLGTAAEVWDPPAGRFRRTLGDPLHHRRFHAAASVRLGAVLLAGGGPPEAERFDPFAETFSGAGTCPPIGITATDSPTYATLTPLPGSRVLLLGGLSIGGLGAGVDLVLSQVQLWDARSGGGYGAFFPMTFFVEPPRAAHTATELPDGRTLVAGGLGTNFAQSERRTTLLAPSE